MLLFGASVWCFGSDVGGRLFFGDVLWCRLCLVPGLDCWPPTLLVVVQCGAGLPRVPFKVGPTINQSLCSYYPTPWAGLGFDLILMMKSNFQPIQGDKSGFPFKVGSLLLNHCAPMQRNGLVWGRGSSVKAVNGKTKLPTNSGFLEIYSLKCNYKMGNIGFQIES